MPRKSLGFYCSVECTPLPLEETAGAALRQQQSQGFVGIQEGAKLNQQEAKGNALRDSGLGAWLWEGGCRKREMWNFSHHLDGSGVSEQQWSW